MKNFLKNIFPKTVDNPLEIWYNDYAPKRENERKVHPMNTKAIDYILFAIQQKADLMGYNLDECADYNRVCEIVTDFEMSKPISFEDKKFCADTLDTLCQALGLNYLVLLDKALGKL